MNQISSSILKNVCILSVLVFASLCKVGAQTNSRVAVTSTENKTNIWVSDFPKNSTVLLIDGERNILSIISTNEYGSAFLSLDKTIICSVIARTMNGDIYVTNEPTVKSRNKEAETAAVAIKTLETKA